MSRQLKRFMQRLCSPGRRSVPLSQLKSGLRDEAGQEVIEFAVGSSVVFMFILGVMELCIVMFLYCSVCEAAREACRWACVRGTNSSVTSNGITSCANPNIATCPAQVSDIQNYAMQTPGISSSNAAVSVLWCNSDGVTNCVSSESNAKPGNIVKVTVSYTFASVPFVSKQAVTLSSTSETVIWE